MAQRTKTPARVLSGASSAAGTAPSKLRIERTIRALVKDRSPATVCPSEVARALHANDWRSLMGRVREVAGAMAQRGELVITQRGKAVDVTTARGPVRLGAVSSAASYADAYRGIDFRARPDLYRVGKGEQGVLIAEPYRSELLPLWRFRSPEVARASSAALWKAFVGYRKARDFVGMDMARKFIQMGYTRARRYARHRSGRKYDTDGIELPEELDSEKDTAARIFLATWQRVNADRTYRAMREAAVSRSPKRAQPDRDGSSQGSLSSRRRGR